MNLRNLIAQQAASQMLIFVRDPAQVTTMASQCFDVADDVIAALPPGAVGLTKQLMIGPLVAALVDYKRNGSVPDFAGIATAAELAAVAMMGGITDFSYPQGLIVDNASAQPSAVENSEGLIFFAKDTKALSGVGPSGGGFAWFDLLSGGAIANSSQVIYRQGAVAPVAPVYGSFSAAYNAIAGRAGSILVDPTLGQPVITPGAYDLTNIALLGLQTAGVQAQLNIQIGATFTGFLSANALTLNSLSNAPIIDVPAGVGTVIYLYNGAVMVNDATSTSNFVRVRTGRSMLAYIYGLGSFQTGNSAHGAVQSDSGSSLVFISLFDGASINPNALSGAGAISVEYFSNGVTVSTAQPNASALTIIDGTMKPFLLDVALTGGTKTIASGKDLTRATLVGVYLQTQNTAVGAPKATFVAGPNGAVTVTSYTAAAAQATTDVSTYRCVFIGAI